jgi:AraC-like DNA-binding protein
MARTSAAHLLRNGSIWLGRLEIGQGWARWQGDVGQGAMHRHVAAQLVLSGGAADAVVETADGRLVRGAAVGIDPLVAHRIRPGGAATLVFIEPWALRCGLEIPASVVPRDLPGPFAAVSAQPRQGASFWQEWRGAGPQHPAGAVSAWAGRARHRIDDLLAAGHAGGVTLAALAALLGVGAEHARHRFVAEFGLPFRRYVLWRRLQIAAAALHGGSSVTASAHQAGFSDAAYAARTLKAMFGVSASQLLEQR